MTTEPQYIEELMQQVEEAEEPGELKEGQVVYHGNDEMPLTPRVHSVESAGYVYIYNTKTGDRSMTNRNMLQDQLKKTFPEDGARVFTTIKPAFEPPRGTYKCLLHVDGPNRAHYDAIGLATCTKDDLASEYQVQRHMSTRHQMEWANISDEQDRAEKDEERVFQRTMMEALGNASRTGVIDAVASNSGKAPRTRRVNNSEVDCDLCGKSFKGLAGLKLHVRQKH